MRHFPRRRLDPVNWGLRRYFRLRLCALMKEESQLEYRAAMIQRFTTTANDL